MNELSNWIKKVERETDLKIKFLWTNGEDYQSQLTVVLKSLGVKHETTPPHTSRSNGKEEGINRTIPYAQCFIKQTCRNHTEPKQNTTIHVKNRLQSDAINDDIPFERWFDEELDSNELQDSQTIWMYCIYMFPSNGANDEIKLI